MATLRDPSLTELTAPAATDRVLVSDTGEATYKDKWMALSKLATVSLTNTFAALQTFGAGINLGHTTLANYLVDSWSPTIIGSTSNPTVAYTVQTGNYTRIGNRVLFEAQITINTISGGSGSARFTLPLVSAASIATRGSVHAEPIGLGGAAANGLSLAIVQGQSYAAISVARDNAASYTVLVSDLAAGDIIQYSGQYRV